MEQSIAGSLLLNILFLTRNMDDMYLAEAEAQIINDACGLDSQTLRKWGRTTPLKANDIISVCKEKLSGNLIKPLHVRMACYFMRLKNKLSQKISHAEDEDNWGKVMTWFVSRNKNISAVENFRQCTRTSLGLARADKIPLEDAFAKYRFNPNKKCPKIETNYYIVYMLIFGEWALTQNMVTVELAPPVEVKVKSPQKPEIEINYKISTSVSKVTGQTLVFSDAYFSVPDAVKVSQPSILTHEEIDSLVAALNDKGDKIEEYCTQQKTTAPEVPFSSARSLFRTTDSLKAFTWNVHGGKFADGGDFLSDLKSVLVNDGADFLCLQELSYSSSDRLTSIKKHGCPENWIGFQTMVTGKSQSNAILYSASKWEEFDGRKRVTCPSSYPENELLLEFVHTPAMVCLKSKIYKDMTAVVVSLHTSPTATVDNGENDSLLGSHRRSARKKEDQNLALRKEVLTLLASVVQQLKIWGLPHNEGSSKDTRKPIPLIFIGGDFNLHPCTDISGYPWPETAIPLETEDWPPITGTLNCYSSVLTHNSKTVFHPPAMNLLRMFHCPMNPRIATSRPKTLKEHSGGGMAYDGFLLNKDFMEEQPKTKSYCSIDVLPLNDEDPQSDHNMVKCTLKFVGNLERK